MKKTVKSLVALMMALLMLANITAALAEDTIGTPTDLAPVETIEETTPGTVRVVLRNQGQLYYGDEVTLEAWVNDVEGTYSIEWQVKVQENKWERVHEGHTFSFILTEENAAREYRAVVTTAE